MKSLYTAKARSVGGSSGYVESSDKALQLSLSLPKELNGQGNGPNVEQVFAAGYAACFETAIKLAAQTEKISLIDSAVDAQVDLGFLPEGKFQLAVTLEVELPGVDLRIAQNLIEKAKQTWLFYSSLENIQISIHHEKAA